MMTARLADGRLVAASPASGLTDEAFKELEGFGGVGAIVATNGFHHLGLPSWQAAFPAATVHAPRTAVTRLLKKQKAVKQYAPLEDVRLAAGRLLDVPGQKIGETWLEVPTAVGPTWYVSDSCFSMEKEPSHWFPRLLFRWTDSAPGFKINGLGKKLFVTDKAAYKRWFLQQLDAESPSRILTAHGAIVEGPNVAAQLRGMAEARL